MAIVETTYDENENSVFTVDPNGDNEIKLATANTYVDKNIVFQIPNNSETFVVNISFDRQFNIDTGEIEYNSEVTMDKTPQEVYQAWLEDKRIYGVRQIDWQNPKSQNYEIFHIHEIEYLPPERNYLRITWNRVFNNVGDGQNTTVEEKIFQTNDRDNISYDIFWTETIIPRCEDVDLIAYTGIVIDEISEEDFSLITDNDNTPEVNRFYTAQTIEAYSNNGNFAEQTYFSRIYNNDDDNILKYQYVTNDTITYLIFKNEYDEEADKENWYVKKEIVPLSNETSKPDWDENDFESDSYIENRTHWREIYDTMTILDEQSVEFEYSDDSNSIISSLLDTNVVLYEAPSSTRPSVNTFPDNLILIVNGQRMLLEKTPIAVGVAENPIYTIEMYEYIGMYGSWLVYFLSDEVGDSSSTIRISYTPHSEFEAGYSQPEPSVIKILAADIYYSPLDPNYVLSDGLYKKLAEVFPTSVNNEYPDENGNIEIDIPSSLPEVSADDNGKNLTVVDGAWAVGNASADVDVATVDETLAFLNIEIPDLTQEEF